MATHTVRIDRSIPLTAQPSTGHNRWDVRTVDLEVSEVVDVPNFMISALLPLGIFAS
jgi:hypothetical protein